jgi:hypothetical protein
VKWTEEELNSYEWKTKRREILYRDKNKCRLCGGGICENKNLEIHHSKYYDGIHLRPWHYNNDTLYTYPK